MSDHSPCPKCGSFAYFVIAGSPDCECKCGHCWQRSMSATIRMIGGGSQWEDGVAQDLRARLEEAIAIDDRIAIFSVRRGHANGEPATVVTATADRRAPCSVSWVEFVGALAIKLHQWMGDTENDDA
jgi:hypothetical protein